MNQENLQRLQRFFGAAGLVLLISLYGLMFAAILSGFDTPIAVLMEDSIPFLVPFMLYLGNVKNYLQFVKDGHGHVNQLHNFILDLWNEAGFLGLAGVLFFLLYMLGSAVTAARRGCDDSGVVLAAAGAILASGMFSFSYSSWQFSCYLFALLVAMLSAARPVQAGDGD